jgi:hypothetical protein
MIGQYLPNNNEKSYSAVLQKKISKPALYLTSDPLRTKRTPVRTTTLMAVNNKLTHGRRQESLNHNTPTSPPVCFSSAGTPTATLQGWLSRGVCQAMHASVKALGRE